MTKLRPLHLVLGNLSDKITPITSNSWKSKWQSFRIISSPCIKLTQYWYM